MTKRTSFDATVVAPLQEQLEQHPVYGALQSLADLQVFMQHHVYSVWDFMSMIKALQAVVAPAMVPWVPTGNAAVRHFINSLVLEEESDEAPADEDGNPVYTSHFELYCRTMTEVGTDPAKPLEFVSVVADKGIDAALEAAIAPAASEAFMRTTFDFIHSAKPHAIAAALALGREHVIPGMFRTFLSHMHITEEQAPAFHYYLNRHIHLDEDFHGPLSLKMLDELCQGDESRVEEAEQVAIQALQARIRFWDGVYEAIQSAK